MDSNAELIANGVAKALQIAMEVGLQIGQVVAHPEDPMLYRLQEIRGAVAVVGYSAEESPDGQAFEKEFPLEELFGVKVARDCAVKELMEQTFTKPGHRRKRWH